MEFCNFIKEIQKDPMKKIENLSIRKLMELKQHLLECDECDSIVAEITEKYKDAPSDSEWDHTKYN